MPTGTYADNHKIWLLLMSTTYNLEGNPSAKIDQLSNSYDSKTFQTSSECYEGLKKTALMYNKINTNFIDDKLRIEIVDNKISAKSKFQLRGSPQKYFGELHCIEISLD